MSKWLLTGAAGRLGAVLREGLGDNRELSLTDCVQGDPQAPHRFVLGDLASLDFAVEVTTGVDAIIHSAGIPDEAPFERLLESNIRATYNVFEAARINGVGRIVYASSAHVIGYHPVGEPVNEHSELRPDTVYATTKVFGEALARLYYDKHQIEVACLRIGSFRPAPENRRQLSTWLSGPDAVRLVRQCLEVETLGFAIVYGTSANSDRWWTDASAPRIGYQPQDDAADQPIPPMSETSSGVLRQGGVFAERGYLGGAG